VPNTDPFYDTAGTCQKLISALGLTLDGRPDREIKSSNQGGSTTAPARTDDVPSREGKAPRTIHAHLSAIKGFTRWLVEGEKLPRDPLAAVKKPNPKVHRRRERRMLLPAEWPHLELVTASGPERYGMSGSERALLYQLAIQTGLRANELRSLAVSRVVVTAAQPYVQVKAGNTKNRKLAQQFIDTDLAKALRAHISRKTPTAKLFDLPHESNLARMLRADVGKARRLWLRECLNDLEAYVAREQTDFLTDSNHDGQVLDFHSLRHTCGAWLSLAGAHPKTVQTVMRHSSINLTMDTYGHLLPGQHAEAVDKLGFMLAHSTAAPIPLRMAATDGQRESHYGAQRQAQQSGSRSVRSGAKDRDESVHRDGQKKSLKPVVIVDLGNAMLDDANSCLSSGGGTRTPDTRIMIPLMGWSAIVRCRPKLFATLWLVSLIVSASVRVNPQSCARLAVNWLSNRQWLALMNDASFLKVQSTPYDRLLLFCSFELDRGFVEADVSLELIHLRLTPPASYLRTDKFFPMLCLCDNVFQYFQSFVFRVTEIENSIVIHNGSIV
jgi:integrase